MPAPIYTNAVSPLRRGDLSIRVVDTQGTLVNLRTGSTKAITAVRKVVKTAGRFTQDRALEVMLELGIYDTGFMYDNLELRFSPEGLAFQVGWWPQVFLAEKGRAYYIYVVEGTSKMPARDPLTPAYRAMKPWLTGNIGPAIENALTSRSAARRKF